MGVLTGHVIRGRRNPRHLGLPARLRRTRKEAGIPATKLSVEAGLSKSAVYFLERPGRVPGVDLVEGLANVLKISPSFLAFGEHHPYVVAASPRHHGLPERLVTIREARGLSRNALGVQ